MGGRLCLVVLTIRSLVCVCLGILMFRRGCDSNIVCLTRREPTLCMHASLTGNAKKDFSSMMVRLHSNPNPPKTSITTPSRAQLQLRTHVCQHIRRSCCTSSLKKSKSFQSWSAYSNTSQSCFLSVLKETFVVFPACFRHAQRSIEHLGMFLFWNFIFNWAKEISRMFVL